MFSFFSKKDYDLNGSDFKQKFNNTPNAVLIDVRTKAEFGEGTLQGAKNLDMMLPGFEAEARKLDRSKTYFLFCRSGNRSSKAASMFEKLGLTSFNLVGGIGAWPR